MLDALQKLVPWATGLPLIPKVAITAVVLLASFVFLYLTWVPIPRSDPSSTTSVKVAYERMSKVLGRIQVGPGDQVLVDGHGIDPQLIGSYSAYVEIAKFVRANLSVLT